MRVTIDRLTDLPAEVRELIAESEQEGRQFLRRLLDEWAAGTNRFARPGESFFVARIEGTAVGVCGLNADPYTSDPGVGRVRRLYVRRAFRGNGVGRLLVQTVIESAHEHFRLLRVRTENPEAVRLYERLGFREATGTADCTHLLDLAPSAVGESSEGVKTAR